MATLLGMMALPIALALSVLRLSVPDPVLYWLWQGAIALTGVAAATAFLYGTFHRETEAERAARSARYPGRRSGYEPYDWGASSEGE